MPLPKEVRYTWEDLMTWEGEERYELIDGVPYLMSPAPNRRHQEISGELHIQIGSYLRDKKCKIFYAPFDIRLFEREGDRPKDIDTVVQPDLAVVCDPDKLDDAGCKGAPDLVVEILSPSTQKHDRFTKFHLYQRAGVREYWIVDPISKIIQSFVLEHGQYVPKELGVPGDQLKVNVLEDCYVDLSLVFPESDSAAGD